MHYVPKSWKSCVLFIYLWIQYKYKEHKRKDYPSKIWPYHVKNPKCGD